MRPRAALLLLAIPALCAADWTPPPHPDPRAILAEAERDTQARRYPDALVRFEWFHQHALDADPQLYALRLSRALEDWAALGRAWHAGAGAPACAARSRRRAGARGRRPAFQLQ
jgi:hypothetical protein